MSPSWLRRRLSSRKRSPASRADRPQLAGCPVLLKRLEADAGRGEALIEALSEHFEVELQDGLYRVTIDDARFPDEAVVKLASALDEIESDWQECFAWPKAVA